MSRRHVPLHNVVGIIIHATISPKNSSNQIIVDYCLRGRLPKVPGPLYNEIVHRDGTYSVLTDEFKANHAGKISSKRFRRLVKGKRALSYRVRYPDDMTANARLYGIAYELAYKEMPTDLQYATMLKRIEAAMEKFNLVPDNVWGHADLTRRKIDPWRPFTPNKHIFKINRDLKKRAKKVKKVRC